MMRRAELNLSLLPKPRTFILSSSTHALIFRPAGNSQTRPLIVEFVNLEDIEGQLQAATRITPCWGCLGFLEIENEIFIIVITHATPVGLLQPNREEIYRVVSVELFCLTSAAFGNQHLSHYSSNSTIPSLDPDDLLLAEPSALNGIKKILSNGQFYFSASFTDIFSRTECRLSDNQSRDESPMFSWNSFMLSGLKGFKDSLPTESQLQLDCQSFLVSIFQGYAAIYDLKLPPSPQVSMNDLEAEELNQPASISIALFSRLSSRRAGTRFNTRGIDDDGHVANYVETEILISIGSILFSFVQVRGSVPVFFEQAGTGMSNVIGGLSGQGHRINITRAGIATQPAFERHFEDLLLRYNAVQIMNLLSHSRESELALSQAYHERLKVFASDAVQMTYFDLHQRAKVGGLDSLRTQLMNVPSIWGKLDQFGFFLAKVATDGTTEVITRQNGVFRTNCLDCLDRTNVVQEMLSKMVVEIFLSTTSPHLLRSDHLWNCHRSLWADNGNVLSKIYAGTGALNTTFTRGGKQTFSGILSNASKSVERMYNSNFIDKSKQNHIDLLLGNLSDQKPVKVFDPINETVQKLLHNRRPEYSQSVPITIWVGTYNLNGRFPSAVNNDELMTWLWPVTNYEPDIMAVAFQEIVKLSPQQIMVTDPQKKRRWEQIILNSLENRPEKNATYLILRSDQLVGAALIILVKSHLINAIRSVEAKTKKTGLKGIAGNKGAVAIRLEVYDTSFCFVTAHFAAGYSNVEERNRDYETIANGLEFSKGRTIGSHENVIWAGDFNYRIGGGLSNLAVRQASADEDFVMLLAADQLLACMGTQSVFPRYLEGPISFAPTYKYDVGSDRYDTSEKMRTPAWTDRILYQGNDLDLTHYARAELKSSDHRPVYALLKAKVRVVDRVKRDVIKQNILASSEVQSICRTVLTPSQAGSSLNIVAPLDEWWKTTEYPDGTYEPTPYEVANVTGHSSHSANRLPLHTFDRQTPSSVPASPPPASAKAIPPAIPARPASRSPSQNRKAERPLSIPLLKKPPPPPPRPTSTLRVTPSKESLRSTLETRFNNSLAQLVTSSPPPIPPKPKPPKPALKPKPAHLNNSVPKKPEVGAEGQTIR
ncbi:hypothetical protein O181_007584 [Austropuccinia psidii MF-1]|uniref:phosphoinositide 5-phosphatase n=1 Tax=Austropuccinia psidii MF-1 TaxID=1389203 RepID=A0A9Q3BM90_9BASI|nr:hypothetical protein [Austropuccinia psidii MF-1]